jgi:hypothetical protein
VYLITKIPKIVKQHDSIMVVVDKLTKVAHFISIKTTQKVANIEDIYVKKTIGINGVPKEIVLDIDSKFTSNF